MSGLKTTEDLALPEPREDTFSDILLDNIGYVQLVDSMRTEAGLKICNAARTSYGRTADEYAEKDKKLVKYLWEASPPHTSPFRHSYFTFLIKAPIFVFRQWMKYQVGATWREYLVDGEAVHLEVVDLFYDTDKGCSWNELSGRYKKMKNEFYVPQRMRANASHGSKQASEEPNEWGDFFHSIARERFRESYQRSMDDYNLFLECGISKEQARLVLPSAVYSQAYWTVSLQGLLHFMNQRIHQDAQWEIRQYAEGCRELIRPTLIQIGILEDEDTIADGPTSGE